MAEAGNLTMTVNVVHLFWNEQYGFFTVDVVELDDIKCVIDQFMAEELGYV